MPLLYTIEVTEEEYESIVSLRSRINQEHQTRALKLLVLATRYLQWLSDNGMGDTYSTFCDDFGYEASEDEDRPSTHADAMSTIRHVYQITA